MTPAAGRPLGTARDQRGAASVELVILVPVLVLMLGLLVAGGRLWFARATVVEASQSAARAASLARSSGEARDAGRRAAIASSGPTASVAPATLSRSTPGRSASRSGTAGHRHRLRHLPGAVRRPAPARHARQHHRPQHRCGRPRHLPGAFMTARTGSDERGQSVSVFITVVFAALIMTAGLVIDGGQKIAAASRAQTAAAGAARAATNAGVTQSLAGAQCRRRLAPSRPGLPRRSTGRERVGHRAATASSPSPPARANARSSSR